MPQVKFRGVNVDKVLEISKELIDKLEQIIGCPREDLTIEYLTSSFIRDGQKVPGYPFVEIAWFDRGQNIQDQVAKAITLLIQKVGYPSVDVIFKTLEKHRYYENGEHF